MSERTESARWWDGAVIYQIYPRSFADGNGDGIGDLAGILERLDHLAGTDGSLGVDAIWLSPIYPSPQHDFGYDISDYTDVAPEYGTLGDVDALIAACHERGLRFLMDLVPCHTSIEHPWFVESRSSRDSPKRDWYLWSDPAPDGGVPTNWEAAFGGSTWEWDPATEQYYLHSFYPEQPDLNWRNPAVAEAMQRSGKALPSRPILPPWATFLLGTAAMVLPGLSASVPYPWGWLLAVAALVCGLLAGVTVRVPMWLAGRPLVRGSFATAAGSFLAALVPLYASLPPGVEQGAVLLAAAVLAARRRG